MYTTPLRRRSQPHLFPKAKSTVLPDPSAFFAPQLNKKPLPTSAFFQNYVLNNGDQPEYIHPYLVKSCESKLILCYPKTSKNSDEVCHVFKDDLAISKIGKLCPNSKHVVPSFSDLSVTLDFPASNLKFFLVRGSPYLTCSVGKTAALSISTSHSVLQLFPNQSSTKYVIKLDNKQVWLLYSSSPINLSLDGVKKMTSDDFVGVIRIAALPNGNKMSEHVLDKYSSCYPVKGDAYFTRPYSLEYRWDKVGLGDLLQLAHPLHLKLLPSENDGSITVLDDFKYESIDGELVGVVGDSWLLKTDPISVSWHSINGVDENDCSDIIEALVKDVGNLDSSSVTKSSSSYSCGKLIARAARLVLIAEEIGHVDVIPDIAKFLKETMEPWLSGTHGPNQFLYDPEWGGIVTKKGLGDSKAEFGFGIYNNHHYNLGFFVYGIAVLAKIDPNWGRKYKSKSYALMADYMNLSTGENADYTRLRCFDLWKLHSWASGLVEFPHGRADENTGEAVNAYYAAALMGLAYGDAHLASVASTLTALEIEAAKTWRHVKEEGGTLYPDEFARENRALGIFWTWKRSSKLWSAPAARREVRLGIQLMPISPISQVLFSDVAFVRELVNWAWPALAGGGGEEEGWRGYVYALQAIYDGEGALGNVRRALKGYDEGNSATNLLWWICSSGEFDGGGDRREEFNRVVSKCSSWFRHYLD